MIRGCIFSLTLRTIDNVSFLAKGSELSERFFSFTSNSKKSSLEEDAKKAGGSKKEKEKKTEMW